MLLPRRATIWPSASSSSSPFRPIRSRKRPSWPGSRPSRACWSARRPGTGKTLIAEAALFEALHTGTTAYYTTPLIALTEQKFREMQTLAVRWGFFPDDVGLVTGNRRENPDARVLVVVAEILLNRLLHREAFDFSNVSAVVMDEFHSFNDPERGIVWELSLGLLPPHVRTLLLSATVGNAVEFVHWLRIGHDRKLELVAGRRAQGAAGLPLGARQAAQRADRGDGRGRRRRRGSRRPWSSASTAKSAGTWPSSSRAKGSWPPASRRG